MIIKSKSRISCSSSSLYQQDFVCCELCKASCQNGTGDLSHFCVQYESDAQCADVIVIGVCNQKVTAKLLTLCCSTETVLLLQKLIVLVSVMWQ